MANSVIPEYLTSRVRWLMLARVVIITFILGLAAFGEFMRMEPLSAISASLLFMTILVAYIFSILFLILLKHLSPVSLNIYIQSICDIALVTAMVYATGGIGSIYSVFYPLIIIYSVLFLGRRGGLIIASTAGIFYGVFADLEFYGVIYPLFSVPIRDYQQNAGYVFTRIITHILSFYLIAILASFVVEQERRTRTLLAEKQTAFDKLDLLHRSIIESVDTGILTVNLRGQIKSLNRAAADITGLSFLAVENKKFSDIFPDCPAFEEQEIRNGNRSVARTRFEMQFLAGGKQLLLGGSVSPLRDPSGERIGNIIIFQDLTAINEMKESLEKSRRLAFIGEMAASLAHEIRNPLASISGSIQMLKRDLVQGDTNARLMQIILRGKDQLESFLKDFLLIARPAPGIREPLDLREMIREVIESLRCIPDWNEELDVELVLGDAPLLIRANRTEVRQIIWNLVLNAVQAMPEGGKVRIEAENVEYEGCDGTEVTIGDTGCGIKDQDQQRIFEPFYTTRDTGTGLGLTVVNRIVEVYRGRIRLHSEPGAGTEFRIWLPAEEIDAAGETS
ncbi:MAG: two-component system sensor histidine kinase NtrB [Syntrophales bacterium]